jgi:hypothetical protein
MTVPLDSADKRILLLAVSLLAILTFLAVLFSPNDQGSSRGYPSSYSTAPDGAKAAYTLLAEMGYGVERWERPPEDLPKSSTNILLIIAGPVAPSSKDDLRHLRQFVAGGGHLLITGAQGAAMIGAKNVVPPPPLEDTWQTFSAEAPSPLTRHASEILMEAPAYWAHSGAGQVRYYGNEQGATVAKLRDGSGDIIWWGSDSPLTNLGITKASNLALFLNCVGSAPGTRVLWDEYFHGVRPGLWHYLSRTPLPWALLQLVVLAAFVVITYARRSGALRPLLRVPRLSPLEFIETVGALYQRKGAAAGALEIAYTRFHFLLARRLGIPSTAPAAELALRMRERPSWMIPGFAETLEQIESAVKQQRVKEPQALMWVDQLYDATHRLGLEG